MSIHKVVVNTRFLLHGKLEGVGMFTYEIIKRLVLNHPEVTFYFLFDRPYDQSFIFAKNVKPIVVFPPARHPLLWWWWFEISIPPILKKINPDVFVSTDGFASLSTHIPTLVVIHDIVFHHFPNYLNKIPQSFFRRFTPKYAHKSDRIVTVATYTKNDISKTYKIDKNKIGLVYNAAKEVYKPISSTQKQAVLEKYTQGNDFFIVVGAIHPRKNVARICRAFDAFKSKNTSSSVKLVIAGRKAWKYKTVIQTINNMQFKKDVIFTGHLIPEKLCNVVASSLGLCYVSLFEGFGIPIVEAMQAGVPVITSNNSSMPEVAGQAGIIVQADSSKEISQAMHHIYHLSQEERQVIIQKGFQQAKKFSWNKSAIQMWDEIKKTIC